MPAGDFSGYGGYCRSCQSVYMAKWRVENRERHLGLQRRWRERTGYDARHAVERRQTPRQNEGARRAIASAEDEAYLVAVKRDPCAYCGSASTELDHVEPGVDVVDNFAASCRLCNSRKGRLPLLRFLIRQRIFAAGFEALRDDFEAAWQT